MYNQSLYKTDGDESSDESQQIFWYCFECKTGCHAVWEACVQYCIWGKKGMRDIEEHF